MGELLTPEVDVPLADCAREFFHKRKLIRMFLPQMLLPKVGRLFQSMFCSDGYIASLNITRSLCWRSMP
jgi:hypothetical protein